MKRNVLFWVAVNSPFEYHQTKHGGFKYFHYSKMSWEYWCKKNDVIFFPYTYDKCSLTDTKKYAATWQRWFDVFPLLESENINYDKIAVIDASTIVRWDTPNFFELTPDNGLTVFRSLENLRWVAQGIDGYKPFIDSLIKDTEPEFQFNLSKYFSCGFQIFGADHKQFLEDLKTFFFKHEIDILNLQNNIVKRGTDQPVYNYLAQLLDVKVNLNHLPPEYFINHMHRFDWLGSNFQLNSNIPHFIKHSYIWFYSGMPNRGLREDLMKQTWDIVSKNYE